MALGRSFLSVRVPTESKRKLKSLAAARGMTLQELVGKLVEDHLEGSAPTENRPLDLSLVLRRLRRHRTDLEARGIAELYVFGSLVRGEAGIDSDVDLAVVFPPHVRPSLTSLASLRAELAAELGCRVDLVELRSLRPQLRAEFDRDAVQVF